jgi:hypothetical protein
LSPLPKIPQPASRFEAPAARGIARESHWFPVVAAASGASPHLFFRLGLSRVASWYVFLGAFFRPTVPVAYFAAGAVPTASATRG